MMPIGDRPVLWHVMRYYAHFGHTEFILCLGYGAQSVKDYFLDYEETASNDFVLPRAGERRAARHRHQRLGSLRRHRLDTAIGERLRRVRRTWTTTRCSSPTMATC